MSSASIESSHPKLKAVEGLKAEIGGFISQQALESYALLRQTTDPHIRKISRSPQRMYEFLSGQGINGSTISKEHRKLIILSLRRQKAIDILSTVFAYSSGQTEEDKAGLNEARRRFDELLDDPETVGDNKPVLNKILGIKDE